MPVNRQKIGSAINAGNFGSRGVPLGLGQQKSILPDLSRFMDALGVAGKTAAENTQKENVETAQIAIREAHIATKAKLPKESDEEHRTRQAEAVNAVREDYNDQGIFVEAFSRENPAVKAIDQIEGRHRAVGMKNTLDNLYNNMKDNTLQEREAAILEALQAESNELSGLSPTSQRAYLENITEYALSLDDKMQQESNLRATAEAQTKNYNTQLGEVSRGLNTILTVSPEAASIDEGDFKTLQEGLVINRDKINSNMSASIKDVYTKHLTLSMGHLGGKGDKVAASTKALDFLIQNATKYNDPDMLSVADTPLTEVGDGLTLNTFYRERIDKARSDIVRNRALASERLRQKSEQKLHKENKKTLNDSLIRHDDLLSDIEADPTSTKGEAAQDTLAMGSADLRKRWDSGEFKGNEFLYSQLRHQAKAAYKMSIDSHGNHKHNRIVEEAMAEGTFNKEQFYAYAETIDPAMKKRAYDYLRPSFESSNEAARQALAAGRELEGRKVREPASQLLSKVALMANQYKSTADLLTRGLGTFNPVDINAYQEEYKQTVLSIRREFPDRLPTSSDILSDPRMVDLQKKYNTQLDTMHKQLQEGKAKALNLSPEEREKFGIAPATQEESDISQQSDDASAGFKILRDNKTLSFEPTTQDQRMAVAKDSRATKEDIQEVIREEMAHQGERDSAPLRAVVGLLNDMGQFNINVPESKAALLEILQDTPNLFKNNKIRRNDLGKNAFVNVKRALMMGIEDGSFESEEKFEDWKRLHREGQDQKTKDMINDPLLYEQLARMLGTNGDK